MWIEWRGRLFPGHRFGETYEKLTNMRSTFAMINQIAILLLSVFAVPETVLASGLPTPLSLNPLFSDGVVLQRDVTLPVFGTGQPGEKVLVKLGMRTNSTTIDAEGRWCVEFAPAPACHEGMALEVSGTEGPPLRVADVLLGDVWLLGGQSNMQHAFRTYPLLKDTTANISHPKIRLLSINPEHPKDSRKAGSSPSGPSLVNPSFKNTWQAARPPYLDEFSPVGYYFGAALQRELKVPIGLVLSAVGGTQIERWIPAADLAKVGASALFTGTPSDLYEKMIAPLRGFAWRGVAWYQGESNANDPLSYGRLLETLITSWRRELAVNDRPFLIVQIAPYVGKPGQFKPETWAWLREQQSQVASKVKNAGLIVTLDLGEAEDIHPPDKQPIGERMALWAVKDTREKVQAASPCLLRQEIKGSEICLTFSETAGGLKTQRVAMNRKRNLPIGSDADAAIAPAHQLVGFQICGIDGVYHLSEGRIEGDQVFLRSDAVSSPKAVRYAWENFPLGNLFGGSGLPAEPFRTDSFPPPDFGLPVEGVPAPEKPPGLKLTLQKESTLENPYGPQTMLGGKEAETILHTTKPNSKWTGRYGYATLPGNHAAGKEPVILSVIYHDDFPDLVKVRYDSSDESVNPNTPISGAFKELGSFRKTGSGGWKLAEFKIHDGRFERHCNGSDIRIESLQDRDLIINGLFVRPAHDAQGMKIRN
jgi:sialate O-acetylesterase